jgi:amidophosphoribosyltransferase
VCGIVGISDHREAARLAYLALFSMQHRGQESAGLATGDGTRIDVKRGMGLVQEVLSGLDYDAMKARSAIGHVRYSTAGGSRIENAQPLALTSVRGSVALAHNGNLTNAVELRQKLEEHGAIFHGTTDTEVILHLMAHQGGRVEEALQGALQKCVGAFSLVVLTVVDGNNRLIAVRDPWGFRPLVMGRLRGAVVFASETCALDMVGARFIRELEPGEMVVAEGKEVLGSSRPFKEARTSACVFEQVYFARPDSLVFGANVHQSRLEMGRQLASEMADVKADMVVPVPDSGGPAALGFSQASGIPYAMGFIRNHYVGRTFIQPNQGQREQSVRMKLHPIREVLEGKRIVLVDDSIVRGTTSRKIVRMLRKTRVKEVHMAISSPAIVAPCFYGIDTPAEDQLIAARMRVDEIAKYLGVDSLHYLSPEGLLRAVRNTAVKKHAPTGHCMACFTREYPTQVPQLLPLGRVGRSSVILDGTPT